MNFPKYTSAKCFNKNVIYLYKYFFIKFPTKKDLPSRMRIPVYLTSKGEINVYDSSGKFLKSFRNMPHLCEDPLFKIYNCIPKIIEYRLKNNIAFFEFIFKWIKDVKYKSNLGLKDINKKNVITNIIEVYDLNNNLLRTYPSNAASVRYPINKISKSTLERRIRD